MGSHQNAVWRDGSSVTSQMHHGGAVEFEGTRGPPQSLHDHGDKSSQELEIGQPHSTCTRQRCDVEATRPGKRDWRRVSRKEMLKQGDGTCLRVATWNALSLDRGSEDIDSKGLAVPAGITWIGKRCIEECIDLVGVQETRIQSLQDHFKLECGYTVVTQAAGKNKGGLILLIREGKHLLFEAVSHIDERVMLVHTKLQGSPLCVVVAHAPVRDACAADHQHFCKSFTHALKGVGHQSKVIVLADLNMRVQGLDRCFDAVGPRALSTCRLKCEHGLPLLRECDRVGLYLANTYVCEKEDFTWTHAKGHRVQIDYVMLTGALMCRLMSTKVIPAASLACVVQSDHDMVVADLVLDKSKRREGEIGRRKAIRTVEQKEEFQRQIANLHRFHAEWLSSMEVEPEDKLNFLDAEVGRLMGELPRPRDHPKKPWISPDTWAQMQKLNRLRGAVSAFRRNGELDEIQCAVAETSSASTFWRQADVLGVDSACRFVVCQQAKVVRKLLIRNKREWFHQACGRLDDPMLDMASLHAEFKRLSRKTRRRQVRLLHDAGGKSVASVAESNEIWAAHWQQQLCAVRLTETPDRSRSFPTRTTPGDELQVPEVTAAEVALSFNKVSSRKAAIDSIHPTAFCLMKPVLIPVLQQLYNKCLGRMDVPHSWREAQLVPVPKKCAPSYSPTGFRPVVLSHNEAKIFERVVRSRIETAISEDVMQFGAGPAVGCDLVAFTHQQLTSELVRQKRPHGILFVDVRGAFDSMVRQLVWATDQERARRVVEGLGLQEDAALVITQAINNQPSLLLQDGIPYPLVRVIESMYEGDWLMLGPLSGKCAIRPQRGTRQGLSLIHISEPTRPRLI
eukprot:5917689-Amphidinium_carterae.2